MPNNDSSDRNSLLKAFSKQRGRGGTRRIARNTLMLYFRQILIMLVSLYTVRVVLNTLGAVDYGIYNVVAGIVTMFSVLSGAMATASQRYFSYDLGRGDNEQLKKTFSVSFTIYVLIAFISVLFAETVGLWFVYNKLIIPPERVIAARWVFQASIFSFVCTILTAPFMAVIIAHEDMDIYAYVSILEVGLKLGIVFLLPYFSKDKLVFYGILLAVVVIVTTTVYRTLCRRKYEECRAKFYWDRALFRELLSYTGWNMFGASVGLLKIQGVNVLLNQFFNPVIITARSIAAQVNGAVNSFAQNFSTAVRPQIIKSYAIGDKENTLSYTFLTTRYTFLLMFIVSVPLFTEMDKVLSLWLSYVPPYAALYTRLTIIDSLFETLGYSIGTCIQATGKIKKYQLVVGSFLLLNVPVSYCFLLLGSRPVVVFVVAIIISLVALVLRLFFLKSIVRFNFSEKYVVINFVRLVLSISCTAIVIFFIIRFCPKRSSLIFSLLWEFAVVLFIVLSVGCTRDEKRKISNILREGLGKCGIFKSSV